MLLDKVPQERQKVHVSPTESGYHKILSSMKQSTLEEWERILHPGATKTRNMMDDDLSGKVHSWRLHQEYVIHYNRLWYCSIVEWKRFFREIVVCTHRTAEHDHILYQYKSGSSTH